MGGWLWDRGECHRDKREERRGKLRWEKKEAEIIIILRARDSQVGEKRSNREVLSGRVGRAGVRGEIEGQ